jgi:hypothetical protein
MVTSPGRKSAAALAAPAFGPARLSPPADLTDPKARQYFLDIVLAARPDHFQPVDVPLLALFCRMLAQAERATEAIAADMVRASPELLEAQRHAAKAVHDLSMRLRVSPQARLSKVNARSKTQAEPTSYYDRWRLEQGNAED